ncbi:MAG: sensor histidine kinase [Butyricicoccus sp.]
MRGRFTHWKAKHSWKIPASAGERGSTPAAADRAEPLSQLQSQINPHFLFNTLQSVANMAGIEQATVTGDMVVRLANFFRYTLDHDDSVVTLDRELALLRDYISLQELRFGERISFEMNCDSRCAACELPKFTLQPIVENSIVHGMRSRSAGGRIRIVTESTPNGCRIQITDNGGGFSRSKMKQNTAEGHRSIGLQNIAGRIALSGGSFRIVSCPGLGTTARIILPMKGEEHIC